MSTWIIQDTGTGLRLASVALRERGSEEFTWADLLYSRLETVRVYVLYFPSRFNTDRDAIVTNSLREFGDNTPPSTSVNFWDPTDPEFSRALGLFDLKSPPALVFVSGLQLKGMRTAGLKHAPLYSIALTDPEVLGDRDRLAAAANAVHEIVARGNPKEIASHVRQERLDALLDTIGSIGSKLRDQLLKLKPKFALPGGVSIQLG